MNLPKDSKQRTIKHSKPKNQTWIVVLAVVAIIVSLVSVGFSGFVYFNMPLQIHNYVQAHKEDLRGEDGQDGQDGRDGANGRNGTNSYSPTYCSTYDYSFGSSTSCY